MSARMADPIFRGATSLIFIIGGLGHFGAHTEMLARMNETLTGMGLKKVAHVAGGFPALQKAGAPIKGQSAA